MLGRICFNGHLIRFFWAFLLSGLIFSSPGATQVRADSDLFDRPKAYCKLGENVEYTKWSGQKSGTVTELSAPNTDWHALRNIANFEHRNDACKISIDMLRMPDAINATRLLVRQLDDCEGTARDEIRVGNVSEATLIDGQAYEAKDDFFITGVQICNNNSSDASNRTLKGLRVRVKVIEPYATNEGQIHEKRYCPMRGWEEGDNRLAPVQTATRGYTQPIIDRITSDQRFSCNNWRTLRECPDGYIATGVQVNSNDAGISGIRLMCREVVPSWVAPR